MSDTLFLLILSCAVNLYLLVQWVRSYKARCGDAALLRRAGWLLLESACMVEMLTKKLGEQPRDPADFWKGDAE